MAIEHWVWYQLALGAGCRRTGEMISYFGNAENLYQSGDYERRLSGVFTSSQLNKLSVTSLESAYEVIEQCRRNSWGITCPDDKYYPKMLKTLDDLPAVLYYQGDLRFLIHKIAVAVVGTREADKKSLSVAQCLSESLTRSGAVVISGGALGVDSAAHTGAMNAGGKTLAVLGCGFGVDYLESNRALREQIAKNGALVTEYPPLTPALARNFPIRNRIISGLCHGTVVIEAGIKSGSLITAGLALEQGRDVFAVPGDVMSEKFTGVHKLISEGAKPVFSAMDVLEGYALKYPKAIDINKIETRLGTAEVPDTVNTKPKPKPEKTEPSERLTGLEAAQRLSGLSDAAKKVLGVFGGESVHIDDIMRKTGLDYPSVFRAVTELELAELISSAPGKQYNLK